MIEYKTTVSPVIQLSSPLTGGSCGTGWGGPKPGDPSSPGRLTATPAWGAVELSWQYPTMNSGAVSHTRIYRSKSSDYATASLLGIINGNQYRDIDESNEKAFHYYWIRTVSIYDTYGELVGPSGAAALSSVGGIIDELSDKINKGMLSQELQKDIEAIPRIGWLESRLDQEIWDREFGHLELIKNTSILTDTLNDISATVIQEQGVRATADAALARSLTEVSVSMDNSLATVTQILEAGISKNGDNIIAMGRRIDEIKLEVDDNLAQAFSTMSTRIEKEVTDREAAILIVSQKIDAVQGQIDGDVTTAMQALDVKINKEITDRGTAIDALARSTTAAQSETNRNLATAKTELNTRITTVDNNLGNRINALSTRVDTVQTNVGKDIASAESRMQVKLNVTNGKVTDIGALYTAKVSVNGLVGGFGIYNDGREIQAGFDVNRFWIGNSSAKRKPFIVSGGVVYIDNAMINNAAITNAKIDNLAVDNLKIANSSVSTGKIQNNAVSIQGGFGNSDSPVDLGNGRSFTVNMPTAGNVVMLVMRGAFTKRLNATAPIPDLRPGFLFNGNRHNFYANETWANQKNNDDFQADFSWSSAMYAEAFSLPAGKTTINFRAVNSNSLAAPIFMLALVQLR